MRYRRLRGGRYLVEFGGRPLLAVMRRLIDLSWHTAPGLPGALPAAAVPDPATFLKLENGGIVRALTLFRAGGRRCETYLYRQGENWMLHGSLFAQRASGPRAFSGRELIVDPEHFLARLAGDLEIDDALRRDRGGI
ncbi:MAG: hypothetical protein R6X25_13785 [Candidatus Krumholzibacteriia bacterium]